MENHGNKTFVQRLSQLIVDKRVWIQAVFILAAIACAFTSTLVKTNESLEHFLPEHTETRQGLELMDQEFITYDTAQVVVKTISLNQAQTLAERIENIPGVKSVAFDSTSDHYESLSALFDVTFAGADDAQVSRDALDGVREMLAGYDMYINTEVGNPLKVIINREMLIVDVIAFIIIVLVLLLTSQTYGEIPVLLLTFGAAALLNMGTNFLMGEISYVTDSIAVVMQLALAIDYAIILCHRYMEEHKDKPAKEAAAVALSKAIPEIAGSSLTTISGLLALTFMQYRLGADMGFVLIKAVALSLLSVFCLMPGLLVLFSGWIDKTHHRKFIPNVPFLGKFAYKTRKVIPLLFAAVLIAAYIFAGKANYVYDQYTVHSLRQNEIQVAREKIQSTFGTPNTLALIVPAGDNRAEKEIVAELKELKHTLSVTGFADIDAVDEYKLLDELTPRQFAELMDIDIEVAQLLYSSYALEHDEYGKVVTGMDSYRITLLDIFDYLLENKDNVTLNLDQETQDKIDELQEELDDGKEQLLNADWSRIVVRTDLPSEGQESYDYLNILHGIAAKFYRECYVVGTTSSCSDLQDAFENDNTIITILSVAFVTLILLFTFRSVGLPLLLIMIIEGSILINFSSPYLLGNDLFFLTYLIISAIQMGANIDYAIVISGRYQEARETLEPREAMIDALNKAFPTVITSGTMMAAAGIAIAFVTTNETISAIGVYLGKGTLISMFLVTCVLPQILLLGDSVIQKTSFKAAPRENTLSHAGTVHLDGKVKGFVNGYIDAEIHGTFQGQIDASVSLGSPVEDDSALKGEMPCEE